VYKLYILKNYHDILEKLFSHFMACIEEAVSGCMHSNPKGEQQ